MTPKLQNDGQFQTDQAPDSYANDLPCYHHWLGMAEGKKEKYTKERSISPHFKEYVGPQGQETTC